MKTIRAAVTAIASEITAPAAASFVDMGANSERKLRVIVPKISASTGTPTGCNPIVWGLYGTRINLLGVLSSSAMPGGIIDGPLSGVFEDAGTRKFYVTFPLTGGTAPTITTTLPAEGDGLR